MIPRLVFVYCGLNVGTSNELLLDSASQIGDTFIFAVTDVEISSRLSFLVQDS